MRLQEFAPAQFQLSDQDIQRILRVRDSDFTPVDFLEAAADVQVMICPLFDETYRLHQNKIHYNLKKFIEFKKQNPLQPMGKRDYAFTGGAPLSGFVHAHLTFDICVVYKVEGINPRQLKLYGIFTHDALGTGQKIRKMLSVSDKIKQQQFAPQK